jgi:hypothetical protein
MEEVDIDDKMKKLWAASVPSEIIFVRSLFYSKIFMKAIQVIYLISWILMAFGLIFLFTKRLSSSNHSYSSTLFYIFYFGYALFYISLPPLIFKFLSNIFLSNDLLPLFQENLNQSLNIGGFEREFDNKNCNRKKQSLSFHFKASIVSKFNYISSIAVSVAYSFKSPEVGNNYWVAVVFCFAYIIPTTTMFILACYILELYRIQEANYLSDIMSLRDTLYQYRYRELYLASNESLTSSPIAQPSPNFEIDSKSSLQSNLIEEGRAPSVDVAPSHPPCVKSTLALLLERYNQLQIYSHSISQKYGHIFFLCLLNSVALIITSIWSLYRKEYSLGSSLGYVFVGLIFFHEIAYLIVEINEKSYLISRELSNCILTVQSFVPSPQTQSKSIETNIPILYNLTTRESLISELFGTPLTGEDMNRYNLFLNCMEYTKIHIFFFGNFVLRFRTLLGFVSSVLAALIPGVIQ